MKPLLSLALSVVCLTTPLHAQEAPLPTLDAQNAAVPTGTSPSPMPSVPAPQLLPADFLPSPAPPAPNPPSIPQLDESFKPAPLSPAAQGQQLNIEWRKLRNRTQNDPAVKAALARAETARTDLEKRELLAKYYKLSFGKMIALADSPQLKAHLQDRMKEQLSTLQQPRVRPDPLAPRVSQPAPSVTPSPPSSISRGSLFSSPLTSPSPR